MSRISIVNLINDTNSQDWEGLTTELEAGSDRAMAILGGVFLEERLRELLKWFLVDDKVSKDLQRTHIARFSTRIDMAYALGLIDYRVRSDLDIIREIRNAFAHSLHGLSFDHPRVTELFDKLQATEITFSYASQNPDDRRKQFVAAVILLSAYIQAKSATVIHEKQQRVVTNDLEDFF